MKLIQPIKGTADQKTFHLVTTVIKNVAFPIRMIALFWIRMFEEMSAIKIGKAMLIIREMGRHPIKDHANIILMQ